VIVEYPQDAVGSGDNARHALDSLQAFEERVMAEAEVDAGDGVMLAIGDGCTCILMQMGRF